MALETLRDYLQKLRNENELVEISVPVDPHLELAEIHRRVVEEEGPALLFTNVKGSSFPVATHLFGTRRRVDLAFGPKPEQLIKQLAAAKDTLLPPSFKALWEEKDLLLELWKVGLTTVSRDQSPILQRCDKEHPLTKLPALAGRPEVGGSFAGQSLVYTEHPDKGNNSNLGVYRMQLYDGQTAGINWQLLKGGGHHYYEAERNNRPLPATVFLGGPPALVASALAPLPEHLPVLLLTSLMLDGKLRMTDNPHGGHRLIADAEFAIVGEAAPHVRRPASSFGDRSGYTSSGLDVPVMQVHHMWHRKDAIFPAAIPGKPQEDYFLGEFVQKLLAPVFPMVMPGVKELWAYAESGIHALTAAVVRESCRREALSSAFRILGEGQLSLTKCLLVTDQPVHLPNFKQLLETVLERFKPKTDLYIINNTPQDTPDFTGHQLNGGSKAILIGVGEPVRALLGRYSGGTIPGIHQVETFCRGCLVASGASYKEDPELARRLAEVHGDRLAAWPLVILADDTAIARSQTDFLWTVFTWFSPALDVHARTQIHHHHIGYQFPIVIDARRKPDYPDERVPGDEVVNLVDSRWKEYF